VHRAWTGKARHIERLRCTLCHREFSEQEGTLMARSKLPEATVIQMLKCQRCGVCDAGTADMCAVDLKTDLREGTCDETSFEGCVGCPLCRP
jgi:hypothetical protein